jgi:hypothetical protein
LDVISLEIILNLSYFRRRYIFWGFLGLRLKDYQG